MIVRRTTRRSGDDGFIVVAALWILGALATLATVYSVYVIKTATAMSVQDESLQAEALTMAAVELTAYRMTATKATKAEEKPTQGRFTFRLGQASVSAAFRAETARIDLNMAPPELLAGLFTALGAQPDFAAFYAGRIVAWRTPIAAGAPDNESADYRTAGLRYGPRHGPFPHPAELALVRGIPAALVERAMPFVTVYSGLAGVNPMIAAPEVVAALPGMTPDRLYAILGQRDGAPLAAQALAGGAQGAVTEEGGKAARVTAQINFDNGRRMGAEVVILLNDGEGEPYYVLSWQDEQDLPPGATGAAR